MQTRFTLRCRNPVTGDLDGKVIRSSDSLGQLEELFYQIEDQYPEMEVGVFDHFWGEEVEL